MWGAVIFCVEQHRGIEPTEGFSDLVSGGSQGVVYRIAPKAKGFSELVSGGCQGAVASSGLPLGAYLGISRDLGGMSGWGVHFSHSSVPPR